MIEQQPVFEAIDKMVEIFLALRKSHRNCLRSAVVARLPRWGF